jgi:hypothetical protein
MCPMPDEQYNNFVTGEAQFVRIEFSVSVVGEVTEFSTPCPSRVPFAIRQTKAKLL